MFKNILVLGLLFIASIKVYAQNSESILTYYTNVTPTNGVKIKTNLPFTTNSQMPTLIFEGYAYGNASAMGLILNYYIYNNEFVRAQVSSFGAYTPNIYLANEDGKVVIFLDSKMYYLRFSLRAFGEGLSAETTTNYSGWTAVDEALSATATASLLVPYQNVFGGKVGIGLSNPQAGLQVTSYNTLANGEIATAIFGSAYNHWTYFGSSSGGKIRGSSEGYIDIETNKNGSNKTMYLNTNSPGNILMTSGAGSVGIGVATIPSEYKLLVNGTIGGHKVKVSQDTWADFVFEPNYNLPTLNQLQHYIHTNKHLPGIPTATEVKEAGLDLGEMNKKLLQKVEELTLYLIDEHQKNEKQAELINSLKDDIAELKAMLKKQ